MQISVNLAFLPPLKLISYPPPAMHHNTPNNTTLKTDAHALANQTNDDRQREGCLTIPSPV